jgi:hypothetical protein
MEEVHNSVNESASLLPLSSYLNHLHLQHYQHSHSKIRARIQKHTGFVSNSFQTPLLHSLTCEALCLDESERIWFSIHEYEAALNRVLINSIVLAPR